MNQSKSIQTRRLVSLALACLVFFVASSALAAGDNEFSSGVNEIYEYLKPVGGALMLLGLVGAAVLGFGGDMGRMFKAALGVVVAGLLIFNGEDLLETVITDFSAGALSAVETPALERGA